MILALVFFLLSIILPGVIQDALVSGIYDQVTLSQSAMDQQTPGWQAWADTRQASSGQYMLVWFYNVTNGPDVLKGETPVLNQVGPYAFSQYNWVQNISFPLSIDGYKLVQFKDWTWFHFNPSMSFPGADPVHDNITIPNLCMLGLFYQNQDVAWGLYHKQSEFERMYATHSPTDWLFGYADPTLAPLHQTFPGVSPNQSLADALNRSFDHVYTGEEDHSLTRQFYMFQESATIDCQPNRLTPKKKPCWATTEANRLHGTDGAQFAPNNIVREGGSVTTWVDDLFRELPLYNTDNETTEIHGITLHKFKVRKEELQCAKNNSNNEQYYSFGLDGYWNITRAQGLLPTFISQPHLLYGNPMMFDYFKGMSPPVKEIHETTLGVELNTGMTLSARKRWQINFGIKPLHFNNFNITWFQNLTMPPHEKSAYLYHPAMWMELQGDVSSDDASTLKGSVYLAQTMITFFKWGGMAIALCALLVALFVWYPLLTHHSHKHHRAMEPMA
jgi:hypothetical protein